MNKSLYIIDGHAQIYAAYYAATGGNFTAPDGEPTKATLIFTTMLLKLFRQRQPDMLVVAMDAPGPSFRREMYEPYKANRSAMPEDLPVQIERIEQILTAMRIPILKLTGYEADDIIGTLTHQAQAKNYQCFICSKDKDLEQLLHENVSMYDPRQETILDPAGLLETKGIRPDQVIDTLTLQGDTSDNIPGVPDVGPKTALQWIQKYGSLDTLIEHKDEIKGKRGDNLRGSLEQLQLSRKLVTLDCKVPVDIDFEQMAVKDFDRAELEQIFYKLNFRRLLEQLDFLGPGTKTASAPTAPAPAAEYVLVDTPEAFAEFYRQLQQQKFFALDTETTGLNPVMADLVGLSFAWRAEQGFYLPVKAPLGQRHLDWSKIKDKLRKVLENKEVNKTGQNIKYDMIVMRKAGINLQGVDFDTMVASYILDSSRSRHNMDSLALDYLGHETIKLEGLIGKGKKQLTFDMVDTHMAADYAGEDAVVTWRLGEYFQKHFTDNELRNLFDEVEMPLVEVLAEMEYQGVGLDVNWLKKLSTKISSRLDELTEQIHKEAGCVFNVDSPKQLSEVLFERLGMQPIKKTKTGASTDQGVLEVLRWQHPVPALMLEYRQLSKLKNTYVDKLPLMIYAVTGRVHASFNQTVAATGRLSSSDPNLQNIPVRTKPGQEIRRAFIAQDTDNVILAADYSQIELRLLAHFSKDKSLREAFAAGEDIHRFVAAQVYGISLDKVTSEQRGRAKAVNFGIIYGQTAYGLSQGIGISMEEARQFIEEYFERYGEIKAYMEEVVSQAKNDGYVRTILGRRRAVPELNSSNQARRKLGERMAVNTVVQGSAADMIKIAMINIYRNIKSEKLPVKMIMQVHDELVFELPKSNVNDYKEMIKKEMAGAIPLEVPVTVDVGWGANWLECK